MLESIDGGIASVQSLQGAWPEILGATVGSFLGLAALMLGALYNARLNRLAERQKALDDKFGVIEALIAEVSSVKHSLDQAILELQRHAEAPPGQRIYIPDPSPRAGIFEKFLSQIELYDENTIRIVCDLYAILDEYCAKVVTMYDGAYSAAIKNSGLLIFPPHRAPAVIAYDEVVSTRCGAVLTELKFQRLSNVHALSRTK